MAPCTSYKRMMKKLQDRQTYIEDGNLQNPYLHNEE